MPPTQDPLTDPTLRRAIQGRPALAVLAGLGGALVGALVMACVMYAFRSIGLIALGFEGAIAGFMVGLTMSYVGRGTYTWLRVVAGVLGLCAAVIGTLLWLHWGTGKSFSVLFSTGPLNGMPGPQTERSATIHTLTNFIAILSYLIAAGSAAYFAGFRPMLGSFGMGNRDTAVPRCLKCSHDLRPSIAQRHKHCPQCGTPIPEQYR
ncbi:MAG: hypothetical protein GC164_11220 [Phycisphaera sp.]|nr:hypothetical protein [Phycisphaera sp.]